MKRSCLEFEQSGWQMHGDSASLLVDCSDEILGGGDKTAIFETEKNIEGRIVNRGDTTYFLTTIGFDDIKPHNSSP